MKSRKITRDGRKWEIPDAFYRISTKLLIKKEGLLLVVKDTTNGTWEIPGGGLDHGETIKQTAKREIHEELGVELKRISDEPIAITLGEHPNNYPTLMLYYQADLASYDFVPEVKFAYKYVTKDEFLQLPMLSDESPILHYANTIWTT